MHQGACAAAAAAAGHDQPLPAQGLAANAQTGEAHTDGSDGGAEAATAARASMLACGEENCKRTRDGCVTKSRTSRIHAPGECLMMSTRVLR